MTDQTGFAGEGRADQFFAQFGEDRLLARLFGTDTPQTCVEVGANDGVTGSVTLHFERAGWPCILVEPNPALCARLREERNAFLFAGAASREAGTATLMLAEGGELAHAASSLQPGAEAAIRRQGFSFRPVEVETAPLDAILERAGAKPGEIAFVSIDVEGHEAAVLDGFTLSRWRPRVLIIEDNTLLFGNTIHRQLAASGYVRFRRTGVNDWYGRTDDAQVVGPDPLRSYRSSMLRARGLMLRRHASARLTALPVVGPIARRAIRRLRGLRDD